MGEHSDADLCGHRCAHGRPYSVQGDPQQPMLPDTCARVQHTYRPVGPQSDTFLVPAFMYGHFLSCEMGAAPQPLAVRSSSRASRAPCSSSPVPQVTSSCCSAPPSSGRCSRPSGQRSGSAWQASTPTTWSPCVGSPTLCPTSSTAGRSHTARSEAPC